MKKLIGIAVVLVGTVLAQDDAPGKGVARLSLISGDVSVKRGDTGEWVAAAVNGPLLAGDRVLTGPGSRAEVQFDWANMVRLSGDAEVRFSELEGTRYGIQVARGTVMFAVLRDSQADVDISTPSISVRPSRKGMYRVSVRPGDTGMVTEVAVRVGEADIFSPRGTQVLRAGKTMLVRGSLGDPEFQTVADLPDDDWDRWNERRNRELMRSVSYNYVDRGIYGAEDLDNHGSWNYSSPYGWVWSPRVAAGWSPYRYGRWNWMDYYGWTWISYDPWGWAPYHYGRWFYAANRWCWWPGGGGVRPFWRPALVAWVGWGGRSWGGGIGVGLGVGGGIGYGWTHIGWLPLAPYEQFYPWYGSRFYGRGGRTLINNTTIVNNINVTNVYRNARINNGVMAVEAERFGRGSVNPSTVDGMRLERAAAARGALPVVPDRASTRMTDRELRSDFNSGGRSAESFYSRRPASAVERVSFDDQRQRAEQITRSAFGENPANRGGREGGNVIADSPGSRQRPDVAASSGREAIPGRDGQNRESLPGRESVSSDGIRRIGQPGEGWRRVGDGRFADGASVGREGVRDPGGRDAGRDAGREANMSPSRLPGVDPAAGAGEGSRGGRQENSWQRFGDPRGNSADAAPARERGASEAGATDRGWRRSDGASRDIFGRELGGGREATGGSRGDRSSGAESRGDARGNSSNDSWRSFGSVPDAGSSRGRGNDSFGGGRDMSGGGSRESGRGYSYESAPQRERIDVSPSIVRDRSVWDGARSGGGGRGSMGGTESPRMESAPRSMESGPRIRGGDMGGFGGGNSPRMDGGSRGGFGGGSGGGFGGGSRGGGGGGSMGGGGGRSGGGGGGGGGGRRN